MLSVPVPPAGRCVRFSLSRSLPVQLSIDPVSIMYDLAAVFHLLVPFGGRAATVRRMMKIK